jgi:hypothetical protein
MARIESAVEKVKRVLALAEANHNEYERSVAMQYAMDFLAKNNLSVADQECFEPIVIVEATGDFRLEPWARVILSSTCALYYTDFYTTKRYDSWRDTSKDVPLIVGTRDNVEVTIEMTKWLLNSIRTESNHQYKEVPLRRSFRLGAADRLFERALEMLQAESSVSSAVPGSVREVIRSQLQQFNRDYLATLDLQPLKPRVISIYEESMGSDLFGAIAMENTIGSRGGVSPLA